MINYIFRVKAHTYSVLVVVRASTLMDAEQMIRNEYKEGEKVDIDLVECAKELSFLN